MAIRGRPKNDIEELASEIADKSMRDYALLRMQGETHREACQKAKVSDTEIGRALIADEDFRRIINAFREGRDFALLEMAADNLMYFLQTKKERATIYVHEMLMKLKEAAGEAADQRKLLIEIVESPKYLKEADKN